MARFNTPVELMMLRRVTEEEEVEPTVQKSSNELVSMALIDGTRIAAINDPFSELQDDELDNPEYTYPFFGEEELVTLKEKELESSSPRVSFDDLKVLIVLETGRSLLNGYFIGGNWRGLDEEIAKIVGKIDEMSDGTCKAYKNWSEYKEAIASSEKLNINNTELQEFNDDAGILKVEGREDPSNPVLRFHDKFQLLLPFFIEAATFIDTQDINWTLYLLLQKDTFNLIGFCTVYHYFRFPEGLRARLSQFLILPEWQAQGLGVKLYDSVMEREVSMSMVKEFMVEDPTDRFSVLKSFCEWRRAYELGYWSSLLDEKEKNDGGGSNDNIRSCLCKDDGLMKLTASQAEKLINLTTFYTYYTTKQSTSAKRTKSLINWNDQRDLTKWRRIVKKGLLRKFKGELPEEAEGKLEKLAELFDGEMEGFYLPMVEKINSVLGK